MLGLGAQLRDNWWLGMTPPKSLPYVLIFGLGLMLCELRGSTYYVRSLALKRLPSMEALSGDLASGCCRCI